MKNKRLYRIAGISGAIIGVYLISKGNAFGGALTLGIGLLLLLWYFDRKWW